MNGYSKGEISLFKKHNMIVEHKNIESIYIKNMVSVIITTFNRYESLLLAIDSVKKQTYKNIEIIIINDCSTDERYYNTKFKNCNVINLSENSKSRFGYACPGGYQRNFGIKIAQGEYIAFLDDDDYWFSTKLELQIKYMKEVKINFSCTEGYIGVKPYNKDINLNELNKNVDYFLNYSSKENFINTIEILKKHLKKKYTDEIIINKKNYLILKKSYIKYNNLITCSSVLIHRNLINKTGCFITGNKSEDYHYWIRVIDQSECLLIKKPLIYYDKNHSGKKSWEDNKV